MQARTRENLILGLKALLPYIALAILGYYITKCSGYRQSSSVDKPYKTDTIYMKQVFQTTIKYTDTVKPKTIIYYLPEKSTNTIQYSDSLILVINELGKEIAKINPEYLKTYPNASKLIEGHFKEKELSLSLLQIDGTIKTLQYPVDYQKYDYGYINGEFSKTIKNQLPKLNTPKKITYNLYGGIDYIPLSNSPGISFSQNLSYRRISLNNFNSISNSKAPLFISLGLRYQIR